MSDQDQPTPETPQTPTEQPPVETPPPSTSDPDAPVVTDPGVPDEGDEQPQTEPAEEPEDSEEDDGEEQLWGDEVYDDDETPSDVDVPDLTQLEQYKGLTQKGYVHRSLHRQLTVEEKEELGRQLSELLIETENIELEAKRIAKDYREKIAGKKSTIKAIAHRHITGETSENVVCVWLLDWEAGQKTLVRTDTYSEVQWEPITDVDRQLKLDLESDNPVLQELPDGTVRNRETGDIIRHRATSAREELRNAIKYSETEAAINQGAELVAALCDISNEPWWEYEMEDLRHESLAVGVPWDIALSMVVLTVNQFSKDQVIDAGDAVMGVRDLLAELDNPNERLIPLMKEAGFTTFDAISKQGVDFVIGRLKSLGVDMEDVFSDEGAFHVYNVIAVRYDEWGGEIERVRTWLTEHPEETEEEAAAAEEEAAADESADTGIRVIDPKPTGVGTHVVATGPGARPDEAMLERVSGKTGTEG